MPFGELIPIFGMLTGMVTIGAFAWVAVKVIQGPVGQAWARRIHGKSAGNDPELLQEVLELRHQVEQLQGRVTDAEERLDFSERLIAKRAESVADR